MREGHDGQGNVVQLHSTSAMPSTIGARTWHALAGAFTFAILASWREASELALNAARAEATACQSCATSRASSASRSSQTRSFMRRRTRLPRSGLHLIPGDPLGRWLGLGPWNGFRLGRHCHWLLSSRSGRAPPNSHPMIRTTQSQSPPGASSRASAARRRSSTPCRVLRVTYGLPRALKRSGVWTWTQWVHAGRQPAAMDQDLQSLVL